MDILNYYGVLELDNNASGEQIKVAYKEKIKFWHPDKNLKNIKKATEMSKLLNVAYEILGDEDKRREYDVLLNYTKDKSINDLNDENFFGSLKNAGWFISKIKDEAILMYKMFRDCIDGKYELNPLSLCTIGIALLYLIVPTDLVPDLIPLFGYTDDSAVIYLVSQSLSSELESYKKLFVHDSEL